MNYQHIPVHFQHQLSCDVGNLVFSLWKHKPAWEVHFLLCHGHQCVQEKPESGKSKFCLKYYVNMIVC